MKPKIVVCASGEGTNFEAIVKASREGRLAADVVGLIANRGKIGAIGRANRLDLPHKIIARQKFTKRSEWDQAMVRQLEKWKADWVVLAGFLALIGPKVLARYPQKVVNSHPALLPKYGGEGMYGDHVHEAVLKAGDKETGVTIHLIDAVYDQGRIIAQERVRVQPGDDLDRLSERVKALEVSIYPKVLNDLVTGRGSRGT
jgi:phosphoribosylglycinamide formyltransferase-1